MVSKSGTEAKQSNGLFFTFGQTHLMKETHILKALLSTNLEPYTGLLSKGYMDNFNTPPATRCSITAVHTCSSLTHKGLPMASYYCHALAGKNNG